MEDCIPKDLHFCNNSKSNLHLHLVSREQHWAFGGGNSAQHVFGSDECATPKHQLWETFHVIQKCPQF